MIDLKTLRNYDAVLGTVSLIVWAIGFVVSLGIYRDATSSSDYGMVGILLCGLLGLGALGMIFGLKFAFQTYAVAATVIGLMTIAGELLFLVFDPQHKTDRSCLTLGLGVIAVAAGVYASERTKLFDPVEAAVTREPPVQKANRVSIPPAAEDPIASQLKTTELLDRLERLAALRREGAITQEEYERLKKEAMR